MEKKFYESPSAEYVDLKLVNVLLDSQTYDEGGNNPDGQHLGGDDF